MNSQIFPAFILALTTLTVFSPAAQADAVADALADYRRQGAGPFDPQAGARRWREEVFSPDAGKPLSCASCHGEDLRRAGGNGRGHLGSPHHRIAVFRAQAR